MVRPRGISCPRERQRALLFKFCPPEVFRVFTGRLEGQLFLCPPASSFLPPQDKAAWVCSFGTLPETSLGRNPFVSRVQLNPSPSAGQCRGCPPQESPGLGGSAKQNDHVQNLKHRERKSPFSFLTSSVLPALSGQLVFQPRHSLTGWMECNFFFFSYKIKGVISFPGFCEKHSNSPNPPQQLKKKKKRRS